MPTVAARLSAAYSTFKRLAVAFYIPVQLVPIPPMREIHLPKFIRHSKAPTVMGSSLLYVGVYFSKDARGV
jgi:hypothetical protein